MCFAPYISLSTFIIEILLAAFFLLKNPKDNLNRIIALISFVLGFYQLNEFLICVTGFNIFTRLAIATTVLLPAIGVYFALIVYRSKIGYYWNALIYAPVVFFVSMFLFSSYYETSAICSTIFIEYIHWGYLGKFFGLYYLVYMLAMAVIFYFATSKVKTKAERVVAHLGVLSVFIFTVPTYIFIWFLPAFNIKFASVLCEFGLLLSIELVILLLWKEKHKLSY